MFPKETVDRKNLQYETAVNTENSRFETAVNDREVGFLNATIDDLRRRLDDAERRASSAEDRIHKVYEDNQSEREQLILMLQHQPVSKPEVEVSADSQELPQKPLRRRWWQRKTKFDAQPS